MRVSYNSQLYCDCYTACGYLFERSDRYVITLDKRNSKIIITQNNTDNVFHYQHRTISVFAFTMARFICKIFQTKDVITFRISYCNFTTFLCDTILCYLYSYALTWVGNLSTGDLMSYRWSYRPMEKILNGLIFQRSWL